MKRTVNERTRVLALAKEVQAGGLTPVQSARIRHWQAVDRILDDLNCDDRLRSGALLYFLIDAGLLPRDRLQSGVWTRATGAGSRGRNTVRFRSSG